MFKEIKNGISTWKRARSLERKKQKLEKKREKAFLLHAKLCVLYTLFPETSDSDQLGPLHMSVITKEVFGLDKIHDNFLQLGKGQSKIGMSLFTVENNCSLSFSVKDRSLNYLLRGTRSELVMINSHTQVQKDIDLDEIELVAGAVQKLLSRPRSS